jgi:hypothetical protein
MLLARHRYRVTGSGGVEHDEPIDSGSVTWPAGQEPAVEFRPVQVRVPY